MATYHDLYVHQSDQVDCLIHHHARQFRTAGAWSWPRGWNQLVETACDLVRVADADLTWAVIDEANGRLRMRRRHVRIKLDIKTRTGPQAIYIGPPTPTTIATADGVILAIEQQSERVCARCSRPGFRHSSGRHCIPLCGRCGRALNYRSAANRPEAGGTRRGHAGPLSPVG